MLEKYTIIDLDLKYDDYILMCQEDKSMIIQMKEIIENSHEYKSLLLQISENDYPDFTLGCIEILPFTRNGVKNIMTMCHFFKYDGEDINTKGFINNAIFTLEGEEYSQDIKYILASIVSYLLHLSFITLKEYNGEDKWMIKEIYRLIKYIENRTDRIEEYFTISISYIKKEGEE